MSDADQWNDLRTPPGGVTVLPVDRRITVLEEGFKGIERTHSRVGYFVSTVVGLVLLGAAAVVLLTYQNRDKIEFVDQRLRDHAGQRGHAGVVDRVGDVQAQQREDRAQVFAELAAIRTSLDEIRTRLDELQRGRR